MRKSHQRTVGSLISTICFFGLAVLFSLNAAEFYAAGEDGKAIGVGLSALACLAGGMRFVIHDQVAALKKRLKT